MLPNRGSTKTYIKPSRDARFCSKKIQKLTADIAEMEGELEKTSCGLAISGDQARVTELTKQLVDAVVDRVMIWPDKRIEIHWKFIEK